jgi:hypothetical protein
MPEFQPPVVSTEAERSEAEWRDLLSAKCWLFVERRSLHSAPLALKRGGYSARVETTASG